MVDPVFAWIARLGLALVFVLAAHHKLRDPRAFANVVRGYALVPDAWAPVVVAVLAPLEALVAIGLLVGGAWLPGAAAAGAGLLVAYSFAIGLNLARGRRDIDCGCLGPAGQQPLSAWLLGRNALLMALAGACALSASARALGWVDAVSIAGGLVSFALVFHAGSQLLAAARGPASPAPALAPGQGRNR